MKLISTCKPNPEHPKFGNNEKRRVKCDLISHRKYLLFRVLTVMIYITFHTTQIIAQTATSADFVFLEPSASGKTRTLFGCTITNFGYGGPAIKFTRFNNQFAIMPGGRGACIINNRYTLGGGGYGMANSIKLQDSGKDTDTTRYYKMGYGGLELGFIIISKIKMSIGGTLLVGAGAEFLESKPESNNEISYGNEFKIVPVLEPSIYAELQLNHFIRLHTGISYRLVDSSDMINIHVPDMSSFSCYIGLLFGKS